MNERHIVYLDESKTEYCEVVLIDANHCPGAVMFLFTLRNGTVFHTGDFRFHPTMLDPEHNPFLCPPGRFKPDLTGITVPIDFLHLDNTFADPQYDFPSQAEAYESLKHMVEEHRDYRAFVFTYHLGKEEVFEKLAVDFDTKIVVEEPRMKKI